MSVMSPLASHILFLPSIGLVLAALRPAASSGHGKVKDPCAQPSGLHTAIKSDSEHSVVRQEMHLCLTYVVRVQAVC